MRTCSPLAARLGIASWHLAMLSAGLAILEVGVDERARPELQQAEAPAVPDEQVEEDVDEVPSPQYVDFIQETHVVRAFSLLAFWRRFVLLAVRREALHARITFPAIG